MLVTPFRLFPIPRKYLPKVGRMVQELDYVTCIEGLAWLNGEKASLDEVESFLRKVEEFGDVDVEVPPMPEDDGVVLHITGGSLEYSKASLMRRFHFFDDFYSTFPEGEPTIPYSSKQIYGAINLVGDMRECLECMRYLNPKSNIEYFHLGVSDMDRETLFSLVAQLTDEERTAIMATKNHFNGTRPYEGTPMAPLAIILEYHEDEDSMRSCFPEYPSYVYSQTLDDDILLTADFSREWSPQCNMTASLAMCLFVLLRDSKNAEHIRRCLTMLGLTCPLFKNTRDYVALPYGIDPEAVLSCPAIALSSDPVWDNVSSALGLPPAEVHEVMRHYRLFQV
jgi:hypothetical protein